MKFMTETKSGGRVVELSEEEMRAFRSLVLAIEGLELGAVYNSGLPDGWQHFYACEHPDLSTTFGAIEEWMRRKCSVNEFEHALEGLKKAINA